MSVALLSLYKPIARTPQQLFVLVRLRSEQEPEPTQQQQPVHLTVALDRSGSMQGRKIEAALATMNALVEELGPEDRFALVSFANSAEVAVRPCAMTAQAKNLVRAALAGILAMRPKYLVLDEPMAGLDPRGREEILTLINDLRVQNGTTIVMVSHSMDDVARYAERIIVLASGSVAMTGTPPEVFSEAEKLLSLGLDIPQATRLSRLLCDGGLDVPEGLCRMDELRDWLIARWKHAG